MCGTHLRRSLIYRETESIYKIRHLEHALIIPQSSSCYWPKVWTSALKCFTHKLHPQLLYKYTSNITSVFCLVFLGTNGNDFRVNVDLHKANIHTWAIYHTIAVAGNSICWLSTLKWWSYHNYACTCIETSGIFWKANHTQNLVYFSDVLYLYMSLVTTKKVTMNINCFGDTLAPLTHIVLN